MLKAPDPTGTHLLKRIEPTDTVDLVHRRARVPAKVLRLASALEELSLLPILARPALVERTPRDALISP